jgi:RNAse (barnase) inhibitor barstar
MATRCNRTASNAPCAEPKLSNRINYRKTFCFFTNISLSITFGLIQLPQNVTLTENYTAYWRQATRGPSVAPGQFEGKMSLLITVPPNLVQSIRAFRVVELQEEAVRLGQHFMYAHCADALTKQQVCGRIGENFHFPKPCSKNFDALRECLTDTISRAGSQPGFIVVLEQLPNTQKFDKEARETLLDVFRDAADYWAEKKVPFRVFYSFE